MALDPEYTPEERFRAWLADKEADLAPLPRRLPVQFRLWSSAALLPINFLIWSVMLYNFGANVRQFLRALHG